MISWFDFYFLISLILYKLLFVLFIIFIVFFEYFEGYVNLIDKELVFHLMDLSLIAVLKHKKLDSS